MALLQSNKISINGVQISTHLRLPRCKSIPRRRYVRSSNIVQNSVYNNLQVQGSKNAKYNKNK